MIEKIHALLRGECENHLMPFFWQHGEDEATLREYMGVIESGGCRAVCVESRPHPDFCGPRWWADMDVILDEARRRGMRVWILDDSHFPTGFANGAVKTAPPELHRQSVCANHAVYGGPAAEIMLDPASCKLLLDAVYEPHWQHYQADFGRTIAGFFSDEPELGNGHIFTDENQLGTDQDLPFAATLPPLLRESLGEDWAGQLYSSGPTTGNPPKPHEYAMFTWMP